MGEKEGYKIAKPMKTAELRIKGIDDGTLRVEVLMAIAKKGKCDSLDIKVGELRLSADSMRMTPG